MERDEFKIKGVRVKPTGNWTAKKGNGKARWDARLPHWHHKNGKVGRQSASAMANNI